MHQLHQHLAHLYVFRLVAELGSFQAAATRLSLPRSSVSKKVMQLESFTGQRLLQRSTRQLRLTDAGSALLEASQSMGELLEKTEQLLISQQEDAVGRVRISSSTLLAQRYLLPRIAELKQHYPGIIIDLSLNDAVIDLIAEGIDIAVRIGHLPDSSLVARRIGMKHWGWMASPEYLEHYGEPLHPDQLRQHQCIVFRNSHVHLNHWPFTGSDGAIHNIQVEETLTTDDARTLVELACMGQGIIMADPALVQAELQQGKLKAVLTHWKHPDTQPIHLVCLGKTARSKAVEVVWQAFVKWFAEEAVLPRKTE